MKEKKVTKLGTARFKLFNRIARLMWSFPSLFHQLIARTFGQYAIMTTWLRNGEYYEIFTWSPVKDWESRTEPGTSPKIWHLHVKPNYSKEWKCPTWHTDPRVVKVKPTRDGTLFSLVDVYSGEQIGRLLAEFDNMSVMFHVEVGNVRRNVSPDDYHVYYKEPVDANNDALLYLLGHHFDIVIEGHYTMLDITERK